MSRAIIGLGSNLGHREGNLRVALQRLAGEGVNIVRLSSVWETDPVPAGQPAFVNAAALLEVNCGPRELLSLLKRMEHRGGRRRAPHWGPRPIDLDLLWFEEVTISGDGLEVPHPRMLERGFVLAPLLEVAERGSELYELALREMGRLGSQGIRRVPGRLRGADGRRSVRRPSDE